jgi:hypothetical protein
MGHPHFGVSFEKLGWATRLRYMHRNPIKRGLVFKPEDWPWSSFRHYATGFEGVVDIESEWTARRRELRRVVLSHP